MTWPTLPESLAALIYSLFFIYFTYRLIGRWYATASLHQKFTYYLLFGTFSPVFALLSHGRPGLASYIFGYLSLSCSLPIIIALAWSIKFDRDRERKEQPPEPPAPPRELSTEEKIEMLLDKNRK